MKGYPKWFNIYFITSVIVSVFVSGILLAPTTMQLRLQWQMPWKLASEDRTAVVAVHALIGFVVCSLLGAIWSIHMRREWRFKKNRPSGIVLVLSLVFLGFSGVGIYYFGTEDLLLFASASHLLVGIAVMIVYVWHSILYNWFTQR